MDGINIGGNINNAIGTSIAGGAIDLAEENEVIKKAINPMVGAAPLEIPTNPFLPEALKESELFKIKPIDDANREAYAGAPTRTNEDKIADARMWANVNDMLARPQMYSPEQMDAAWRRLSFKLTRDENAADRFKYNYAPKDGENASQVLLQAFTDKMREFAEIQQSRLYQVPGANERGIEAANDLLRSMYKGKNEQRVEDAERRFAGNRAGLAAFAEEFLKEQGLDDYVQQAHDLIDNRFGATDEEIQAWHNSLTPEEKNEVDGMWGDAKTRVIESREMSEGTHRAIGDFAGMLGMDGDAVMRNRPKIRVAWPEGSAEARYEGWLDKRDKWIAEQRLINKMNAQIGFDKMYTNAMTIVPYLNDSQKQLVQIAASGADLEELRGVLWLMKPADRKVMMDVMTAVKPVKDYGKIGNAIASFGQSHGWVKGGRAMVGLWATAFGEATGNQQLTDRQRFDMEFDNTLAWDKLKTPTTFWERAFTGFGQSAGLQGAAIGGAMAFNKAAKMRAAWAAAGKTPGTWQKLAAFGLTAAGVGMESYGLLSMVGDQYENMLLNGVPSDKASIYALTGGSIDWIIENLNVDQYLGLKIPASEQARIGLVAAIKAGVKIRNKAGAAEFGRVLKANFTQGMQIAISETIEEYLQGLNQAGWLSAAQGNDLRAIITDSEFYKAGLHSLVDAVPACTMFGITGAAFPAGGMFGFKQQNVRNQATAQMNEDLKTAAEKMAREKFGAEFTEEQRQTMIDIITARGSRVCQQTANWSGDQRAAWLNQQTDMNEAERAFYAELGSFYDAMVVQEGEAWTRAVTAGDFNLAPLERAGIHFTTDEKTGKVTQMTFADGTSYNIDDRLDEAPTMDTMPSYAVLRFVQKWNATAKAEDKIEIGSEEDLAKLDENGKAKVNEILARSVEAFWDESTRTIHLFNTIATNGKSVSEIIPHESTHAQVSDLKAKGQAQAAAGEKGGARAVMSALVKYLGGKNEFNEGAAQLVEAIARVTNTENTTEGLQDLRETADWKAITKNVGKAIKWMLTGGKAKFEALPAFRSAEGARIDPQQMFADILADAVGAESMSAQERAQAKQQREELMAKHRAEREEKAAKRMAKAQRRAADAEKAASEAAAAAERLAQEAAAEQQKKHEELVAAAMEVKERNRVESEFKAMWDERLKIAQDRARAAEEVRRYEVQKAQEQQLENVLAEIDKENAAEAAALEKEQQRKLDEMMKAEAAQAAELAATQAEEERKQQKFIENRKRALKVAPPVAPIEGMPKDAAARIQAAYLGYWNATMGKGLTDEEVKAFEEEYSVPAAALRLERGKNGKWKMTGPGLKDSDMLRLTPGLNRFFLDINSAKILVRPVIVNSVEELANAVPNEVYDPVSDTFIQGEVIVAPGAARSFREEAGLEGPSVTPAQVATDKAADGVEFSMIRTDGENNHGIQGLDRAKAAAETGATMKDVWRATGWWRGVDGKWHFELKDFKPGEMMKALSIVMYYGMGTSYYSYATIGSIRRATNIEALNALAAVYPQIDKCSVYYVKHDSPKHRLPRDNSFGMQTWDEDGTPIIEIYPKVFTMDAADASTTMMHEIQHLVQVFEGVDAKKGDYRARALRPSKIKEQTKELRKIYQENSWMNIKVNENDAIWWTHLEYGKDASERNNKIIKAADAFAARHGYASYEEFFQAAKKELDKVSSFADYQLDNVETEARLVERRMKMTEEERAAEAPWETATKMLLEEGYDADQNNWDGRVEFSMSNEPRTTRLAPNGKRSNLSDRLYDLVRTQAFKNWFGDWENDPANSSKVVDENGEPLVVYHGSRSYGFSKFKTNVKNTNYGAHFGDRDAAEVFDETGDNTYEVFLNIRKPLETGDIYAGCAQENAFQLWSLANMNGDPRSLKIAKSLENKYEWLKDAPVGADMNNEGYMWFTDNVLDNASDIDYTGENDELFAKYFRELMKLGGYDGTIYENVMEGSGISWVALDPRQIKSIDNRGTFDPRSENIYFSMRQGKAPSKSFKAYKLMRLYEDGSLGWLFIDRAARIQLGSWYNGDSPDLSTFEKLERGFTYLVDASGNATKANITNKKMSPSVAKVNEAANVGSRYFFVGSYKDGSLKVENWGINGSGAVAPYALRPGIHATNAPSATHIGKQKRPDGTTAAYRDAGEVWVEIEVSADNDYQDEAMANGEIIKSGPNKGQIDPSTAQIMHLPTDGSYFYKTNSNASDKQKWIIAGAIKPVRILSDSEVEQINSDGGFDQDLPRIAPRIDANKKVSASIAREAAKPTDQGSTLPEVMFSTSGICRGVQIPYSIKDEDGTEMFYGPADEGYAEYHNGTPTFYHPDGKRVISKKDPITAKEIVESNGSLAMIFKVGKRFLGDVNVKGSDANQLAELYAKIVNTAVEYSAGTDEGLAKLDAIWKWAGASIFKSVKANGDAQYSLSIDLTTICKKTEQIINAVSEFQVMKGHGATPGEMIELYLKTGEAGFQTPCPCCYVFSHWIRSGLLLETANTAQQKYAKDLKMITDLQAMKAQGMTDDELQATPEYKKALKVWRANMAEAKDWIDNKENASLVNNAKKVMDAAYNYIDSLCAKIADEKKKANPDEKAIKADLAKVHQLSDIVNREYKLIAQSDFAGWIKCCVIKARNSAQLILDYKEVPKEILFAYNRADELVKGYPAMARFRTSKGSAGGKAVENDAQNEVGEVIAGLGNMSYNPFLVPANEDEKARAKREADCVKCYNRACVFAARQRLRGGQRIFSWSDNLVKFGPDMFLNFLQLQAIGASVQSYSKQLEGVELITAMGGYNNVSLMAYKNGYIESTEDAVARWDERHRAYYGRPVMLEGKWYQPAYSVVQGINAEELFKLNRKYDKSGNIIVGMSETHIAINIGSDDIFFCIPWHASALKGESLEKMMRLLGEPTAEGSNLDHTPVQGDGALKEPKPPKPLKEGATDKQTQEYEEAVDKYKEDLKAWKEGAADRHLVTEFWDAIARSETSYTWKDAAGKTHTYGTKLPSCIEIKTKRGLISQTQAKYFSLRERILIGTSTAADRKLAEKDVFLSQLMSKLRAAAEQLPDDLKSDESIVKDGMIIMQKADVESIYPYEYWDTESTFTTQDVNGQRYLEYCRRLGFVPKFCGFKKNGQRVYKKGSKKTDPNRPVAMDYHNLHGYCKLLIDRRMYDLEGNYQDTDIVNPKGMTMEMIDKRVFDTWKDENGKSLITTTADRNAARSIAEAVDRFNQEAGIKYIDTAKVTRAEAVKAGREATADWNAILAADALAEKMAAKAAKEAEKAAAKSAKAAERAKGKAAGVEFSISNPTLARVAAYVIARQQLENGKPVDAYEVKRIANRLGYRGSINDLRNDAEAKAKEVAMLLRAAATDMKVEKMLAQAGMQNRHERILARHQQASIAFAHDVEKAQAANKKAQARILRATTGLDADVIMDHYGIDPKAILLAMQPKEYAKGDKAAPEPKTEAETAIPHSLDPESLKLAQDTAAKAIERAKELAAKAKAERDANPIEADDEGARKSKKDDRKLSAQEEADIAFGNLFSQAYHKAISESGITLDDAYGMVALVKAITEQYIRENPASVQGVNLDDIWAHPVARRMLAGNIVSFATMAAEEFAPSFARERVAAKAQQLEDTLVNSLVKIEEIGVNIFEDLNRDLVRQSRKQLMREIHKIIDKHAKHFVERELNLDRKIAAPIARYLKFVRSAVDMNGTEVEERAKFLEEQLTNNYGISDKTENERYRDYADWKMELDVLDYYGALKERMPSEIQAARDFLEQMVNESMFEMIEFGEKWEAVRNEAVENCHQAIVGDPKNNGKTPDETPWSYSIIGMWEPKVRQLTRFCKDNATRQKALNTFASLESMIQRAADEQFNFIEEQKAKLLDVVLNAYGGESAAKAALSQELDGPEWEWFHKDGQPKHTLTIGRLLQMYVSIVQADYADNIEKWGRDGEYRDKLRAFVESNEGHMKFVNGLRQLYLEMGDQLDEVLVKTTGTHLRTPNKLYMPVKMARRNNRKKDAEIRAYSPFAPALAPRVKNGLDFDESADILDMFLDRVESSAHTIAWSECGSLVMGVAQSDRVLNAIETAFGSREMNRWNNYILDIVAGPKRSNPQEASAGRVIMRFASRLWLMLNPASWAKQIAGCPAFALSLYGSHKEWIASMASWAAHPMQMAQIAKDLAGTKAFKARYGTSINLELRTATTDASALKGWWDRLVNAGMSGVSKFDEIGVFALAAVYARKREEFESQGKPADESSELASEWLMHIVDKTAQTSRTLNLTEVQRAGGAWMFLLQFKSSPVQQTQFEIVAFQEWNADRGNMDKAKKFLSCVAINHLIIPVWNSVIEGMLSYLTSWGAPDEEKRRRLFRILFGNMISGSLGSICFAGALIEGVADIIAGYAVGDKPRYRDAFGEMVPAGGALSSLGGSVEKFVKAASEMGEDDFAKTAIDMAEAIGGLNWVTRTGFKAYRSWEKQQ